MFVGRITRGEPRQIIRRFRHQRCMPAIQNAPLARLLDKAAFDELCDEQTSRKTALGVADIEVGACGVQMRGHLFEGFERNTGIRQQNTVGRRGVLERGGQQEILGPNE